jgi:hypothetical protein
MTGTAIGRAEMGSVGLRRVSITLLWTGCLVGAVALVAAGPTGEPSGSGLSGFTQIFAGLAVDVMVFASVGAILVLRRPGNRVGLVLVAAAVLMLMTFLGFILGAVLTSARGASDLVGGIASLLGGLGIYPTLIVAGPALALVFPDGHLPGPRWRWPVLMIVAMLVLGGALVLVRPGPMGASLAINPVGMTGIPWLEAVAPIGESLGAIALPLSLILAVAAVVVRARRSRGMEREQLKWFVAANVMVAVFLTLSLADGASEPTVFDVTAVCSLSLPPIAVGIAVLRYRLYEIDRLISCTVSWAAITGVLLAVFAVLVVGLQAALAGLTQGDTLAVAASTLMAFALFQPVRRRVQRTVDRRFDRARYDGERTAAAFAERLRDQVDLAELEIDIAATVAAALRPSSTELWIRERDGAAGRTHLVTIAGR